MLDFDQIKENQRAVQFSFILNEPDLAITFCETALAANTAAKTDRNRKHAADAYRAAIQFTRTIRLTPKMVSEINERARRLKGLLGQLKTAEQ